MWGFCSILHHSSIIYSWSLIFFSYLPSSGKSKYIAASGFQSGWIANCDYKLIQSLSSSIFFGGMVMNMLFPITMIGTVFGKK
jgi:hypothetical protein